MAESSTGSNWIELALDSSPEAVDAIAEVFRGHGIGGISVEQALQPGADEEYSLNTDVCLVKAYIPDDAQASALVERLERDLWHLRAFDLSPVSDLRTRVVAEEDWANAWKEHFHPLRVGERLIIKPSWRQFEPSQTDIILELDPGMAFGTGLHPTTRMVLEELENTDLAGAGVFDVGTGSGILSLAAAKLGAASVLAVDTESIAVRVARENVELNGLTPVIRVEAGSASAGQDKYDVILANIIATVIADLAAELAARLKPSGVLLASGIIAERLPLVESAFAQVNLEIIRRCQSGDWLCLVARPCAV